ncbi:MAG TPA: hypothetical protein VIY72_16400 [Acidimicrobiales bacterium]
MAPNSTVDVVDGQLVVSEAPGPARPKRSRRLWKVLIGIGVVVVLLIVAAVAWFFLGREEARPVSDDQALEGFRGQGGTSSDAAGLPAAGVYTATATGTESVGIPGFDENLGPNAPVTVTHDAGDCFTYRADFNSHYWRNWTWCPTTDATFAVTTMVSRTGRSLPGVEIESLATYTCDTPIPFLWADAAVGDQRTGSCTGVVEDSEGVTGDAAVVEVLDRTTLTVAGEEVDVIHLRSTETLSDAQTGNETDEWWIDADTGLPVRIEFGILAKGSREYTVTGTLELTTLTPAT